MKSCGYGVRRQIGRHDGDHAQRVTVSNCQLHQRDVAAARTTARGRAINQGLPGSALLGEAGLALVHADAQGQEADGAKEQEDVVDQEEANRILNARKHDYHENA